MSRPTQLRQRVLANRTLRRRVRAVGRALTALSLIVSTGALLVAVLGQRAETAANTDARLPCRMAAHPAVNVDCIVQHELTLRKDSRDTIDCELLTAVPRTAATDDARAKLKC